MKQWVTTILFSVYILLALPICQLCTDQVHRFYFLNYGGNQALWSAHYDEMISAQNVVRIIVVVVALFICLLFILSSLCNMRSGSAKHLLLQAIVAQGAVLVVQTGLVVFAVLAAFAGILNVFVAVLTLPVLYLMIGIALLILEIAGAFRGIAGVARLKRDAQLKQPQFVLH